MSSSFDLSKPVAIGSDHAGYDFKEELISFLEAKNLLTTISALIQKTPLIILILPIL